MMISPYSYISEQEDKSYAELLTERKQLIQSIEEFESSDYQPGEDEICPGRDVIYQCNLDYLSALCKLISAKYRIERLNQGVNEVD